MVFYQVTSARPPSQRCRRNVRPQCIYSRMKRGISLFSSAQSSYCKSCSYHVLQLTHLGPALGTPCGGSWEIDRPSSESDLTTAGTSRVYRGGSLREFYWGHQVRGHALDFQTDFAPALLRAPKLFRGAGVRPHRTRGMSRYSA